MLFVFIAQQDEHHRTLVPDSRQRDVLRGGSSVGLCCLCNHQLRPFDHSEHASQRHDDRGEHLRPPPRDAVLQSPVLRVDESGVPVHSADLGDAVHPVLEGDHVGPPDDPGRARSPR